MKKYFSYLTVILFGALLAFASCSKDDDPEPTPDPGPTVPDSSTTDLNVKKFDAAPVLDGTIDEMWGEVEKLYGAADVLTTLANRNTYYNPDGEGTEEGLGIFHPYAGESYDYSLRAGYDDEYIYFLMEWADDEDSKDRQSWYWDPADSLWKGEHKYANAPDDKFYEDKFAFLFPIGDVETFDNQTCWATCHQGLNIVSTGQKHTRHYTSNVGEVVDMWHWKRVRGTYADQVDDQQMVYNAGDDAGANGRTGDEGDAGYSNNSQDLNGMSVPKYIIPLQEGYYWISQDDIDDGTAKLITNVTAEGVLILDNGASAINPSAGGFEQGTGAMRIPSVTTKAFTMSRADIDIKAVHTGTGWVCEFKRKLNTGHDDDVVFDPTQELMFGLAIFNNAAIAHAIKANLKMKFEQ